jgi:GTPase
VLGELDSGNTPRITVLNKADLLPPGQRPLLGDGVRCVISARTGDGLPALLAEIESLLHSGRQRLHIRIPAGRGDLVARLHRAGTVLREHYEDGKVEVTALVPAKLAGQVRKELIVDRVRERARQEEQP